MPDPQHIKELTQRPTFAFLLKHPAHFIALGAGSGLCPLIPGTAGTIFGWMTFLPFYLLLSEVPYGFFGVGLIIALSFLLGLWACKVTTTHMQAHDPGCIVWDEVVAFWLILYTLYLIGMPHNFLMQLLAFVLFRFFDMVKKGPVRWADERFSGTGYLGAFGIMIDDIVAAILAIICAAAFYLLAYPHLLTLFLQANK